MVKCTFDRYGSAGVVCDDQSEHLDAKLADEIVVKSIVIMHQKAKGLLRNATTFLKYFHFCLQSGSTQLVRQILSNRRPLGLQRSMVDTQRHGQL